KNPNNASNARARLPAPSNRSHPAPLPLDPNPNLPSVMNNTLRKTTSRSKKNYLCASVPHPWLKRIFEEPMPTTMKLLLKESVKHVGKVGDVVEVSAGFARNFLLPQDLAVKPTPGNM